MTEEAALYDTGRERPYSDPDELIIGALAIIDHLGTRHEAGETLSRADLDRLFSAYAVTMRRARERSLELEHWARVLLKRIDLLESAQAFGRPA